jgi:hypothetical protein
MVNPKDFNPSTLKRGKKKKERESLYHCLACNLIFIAIGRPSLRIDPL